MRSLFFGVGSIFIARKGAPASSATAGESHGTESHATIERARALVPTAIPELEFPDIPRERRWPFYEFPASVVLPAIDSRDFTRANGAKRANIEAQMRMFLARETNPKEMFPEFELGSRFGRQFHTIRASGIRSLFPASDFDIRKLLDSFSALHTSNLLTKILLRRCNQFICTLLTFAASYKISQWAAAYLSALGELSFAGTVLQEICAVGSAYLVFGVGLFWIANQWIETGFQAAIGKSCGVVSLNMTNRLNGIGRCLINISAAVRNDLYGRIMATAPVRKQGEFYDEKDQVWVNECNYYMSLLLWFPLRSLHIDAYFRVAMWKTRRHAVYMQLLGGLASVLTAALCIAIAYVSLASNVGLDYVRLGVFSFFALIVAYQSFRGFDKNIDLLSANIPTGQWQTLGTLGMDREIGGVVEFLIRQCLILRDRI